MKWSRLLSLTVAIPLAAASLTLGHAGPVDRYNSYHSHVTTMPHVTMPMHTQTFISEPLHIDQPASIPQMERCVGCGVQSATSVGYYKTSEGKFRLKPGCRWVYPNDNSDLSTRCD